MPIHSSDQTQKLEALGVRDVVDVLRNSVDQRQAAFHELDAVNRGPRIERPSMRLRPSKLASYGYGCCNSLRQSISLRSIPKGFWTPV